MKKEEFISQFLTNFLSSYFATHYDEDCQNGHIMKRDSHPPIEDGLYIANKTWKNLKKFNQDINNIEKYFDFKLSIEDLIEEKNFTLSKVLELGLAFIVKEKLIIKLNAYSAKFAEKENSLDEFSLNGQTFQKIIKTYDWSAQKQSDVLESFLKEMNLFQDFYNFALNS